MVDFDFFLRVRGVIFGGGWVIRIEINFYYL